MSKYTIQITRIKEKFNQAKEIDSEFKVFGASKHQYILGEVATQTEVDALEKTYNCLLPSCYKAFIMEFNAIDKASQTSKYNWVIPAPFYGLYSFDLYMNPHPKHNPFEPLCKILGEDSLIYPYISSTEYHTSWKILEQNKVWIEMDRAIEEDDEEYYEFLGLLPLGDRGCHYTYVLVVTGEHKGRVVYIDESNIDAPFFTYEANFLDWYERWLDEIIDGTLLQKNVFDFAYSMQGGEKELFEKLTKESDNHVKSSILNSIGKFKALDNNSIEILFEYLESEDKGIYYEVIGLLTKHRYSLIKDELKKMILGDEEMCRVSCEHIMIYAKKYQSEWIDILVKRLSTIEERETFQKITLFLDIVRYDYSKDIVALEEKEVFKTLVPYTIRQMKSEPLVHQGVSKLHRFYRGIRRLFS